MTAVIVEHAAYAITEALADLRHEVERAQSLDDAMRMRDSIIRPLVKELQTLEESATNWTNAFRGEQ